MRALARPRPIPPASDQESVWSYPRPPRVEPCRRLIQVIFGGETIAQTRSAYRVLETSHPPVYYLPAADVRIEHLRGTSGTSFCEWKGTARYYDVVIEERRAERAVWSYPDPFPAFAAIRDHLAFYADAMDGCLVDGEVVVPQPGGFYGGWITSDVVGPFKGEPGSRGW